MQELHLSSEGSDPDVPESTGNHLQGANLESSGMGPPGPPKVPDAEPSIPPGMPSLDQGQGNGQGTLVPQPEVNPLDPDTSAPNPSPMPVEQTIPPSPNLLDSSMTAASRPGPSAPLGLPAIPTTSTTTQTGSHPHTYSFAGVMDALKEVCSIMTTRFQRTCLDVEAIVKGYIRQCTANIQKVLEVRVCRCVCGEMSTHFM